MTIHVSRPRLCRPAKGKVQGEISWKDAFWGLKMRWNWFLWVCPCRTVSLLSWKLSLCLLICCCSVIDIPAVSASIPAHQPVHHCWKQSPVSCTGFSFSKASSDEVTEKHSSLESYMKKNASLCWKTVIFIIELQEKK